MKLQIKYKMDRNLSLKPTVKIMAIQMTDEKGNLKGRLKLIRWKQIQEPVLKAV